MRTSQERVIVFAVLLILVHSLKASCPQGQVYLDSGCRDCQQLKNTMPILAGENVEGNTCPCKENFFWSDIHMQCIPLLSSKKSILSYSDGPNSPNNDNSVRLLVITPTCNAAGGFISYKNTCVNCRAFPYAMGVVITTNTCSCFPSFSDTPCYCNWMNYIDIGTGLCNPCTIAPAASQAACASCSFPFAYSYNYGCVYCPSLANNGGSTSCCATGFTFNQNLGICVCNNYNRYSVGSNGICTKCASGDTNCISCVNSYVYNGFYCVHGSLIPQYDVASNGCKTGYALKKDAVSGMTLSCACSAAAGSYIDGATCTACATTLPSGVTLTNCQTCATSSGFYRGPTECVYCPGSSNSVGTATINGCDCQPNYYWNINTGNCECDFTKGFVGGAINVCIDCSTIANTGQAISPNSCSCVKGYIWDTTTSTCICDVNSNSVFLAAGSCIDCSIIVGSTGKLGTDSISCVCFSGYTWSYGSNKCVCDSSQNFALMSNGLCKDCMGVPLSTGLGAGQGCACRNGFSWNPTTSSCVCASGSVVMGANCVSCSSATFTNGASSSDCTSCSNSQGFATHNGYCVYCPSQSGASATVTGGSCTCLSSTMVLKPHLGGCVCDWSQKYISDIQPDGSFKCSQCTTCSCKGTNILSFLYAQCSNCQVDPNAYISGTKCLCKSGYTWIQTSYPFKCAPGFKGGQYLSLTAGTPTYSLCTSLSTTAQQSSCKICDATKGFLYATGLGQCLLCSTVSQATGAATESSCVCQSGNWNPATLSCDNVVTCTNGLLYDPATMTCSICDPLRSANIGGTCISCAADPNSNGYADTSSSCQCLARYIWTVSGNSGSCSSATCDSATSIWIGSTCFQCPTTGSGTGAPTTDTACGCSNNFQWLATPTGGSCVCPSSTSIIVSTGQCFTCPTNSNTTSSVNAAGTACLCNLNFVWDGTTAMSCICDSTVNSFITTSGACFTCSSSVDPNFDGTLTLDVCTCKNSFVFVMNAVGTGGSCQCTAPSVVRSSVCFTCPSNSNTTGIASSVGCNCFSDYIWSSSSSTCLCDTTVNGYLTSSGSCLLCTTANDPNFVGTSTATGCDCGNSLVFVATATGGSCQCAAPNVIVAGSCAVCPTDTYTTGTPDTNGGCLCSSSYVWVASAGTCKCDATVSGYTLGSGDCFRCLSSVDPNFDGTIVNSVCNCRNGFSFSPSTSGGSCECATGTTAMITSTGLCFTCPFDKNSAGLTDSTGTGCLCLNGYVWDSTKLSCSCGSTNSIILNNGSCQICGTTGTYTTIKATSSTCKCSSTLLVWNPATGTCDCGTTKVMVVTGTSFTCKSCSSLNGLVKDTPYSCTCAAGIIWNPTTNQCDCGMNSVYIPSTTSCLPCNAVIFANGLNPTKPNSCACISANMTWSTSLQSCRCNSGLVVFTALSGSFSCVSCSSVYGKNKNTNSATSCDCYNNQFVWTANVGCTCVNSLAIILGTANNPQCVVCNATNYSSGPSADGKSCLCLGNLVWNAQKFTCGCASGSAITNDNGQYSCTSCNNATNYIKSPVVGVTQCTCASSSLVWYPLGYCGCPDPTTQVVAGAGSKSLCITCNSSINSNGKISPSSAVCSCVSSNLVFKNGVCDCGSGFAYIVQGLTNYICINCSNSALFVQSKASSSACKCVSTKLTWDNVAGMCNCPSSSQIIVGTGSSAFCSGCTGQYTVAPNGYTTCSCFGTGLVFTPSKTAAGACACPKYSIMLYSFVCFACPSNTTAPSTPYECPCPTGSIWNNYLNTCQACSSITNAKTGTSLACNCTTGYVWDVISLTCIAPCASGASCMNCAFSGLMMVTSDPASTLVTAKTLTGGSAVEKLINLTYTNYNSIKGYQCTCLPGYTWDSVRMRCFSSTLL